MSSKRLYYALTGLVCLLVIGLAAGTYGINKMLAQKSTQLADLKAKSQGLEQEQQSLAKAKKDLENYADLEKIAKAVVPQDKDQAQTTREIVKIAEANGISLASITFPASSLGSSAKAGSGSGGGQAAGSSSKTGLSQLQPVKNISGVYSLLITVQSDSSNPVPYDQFINFLNGLERNRRTAQVNTISITPDSNNRNLLSFTLTLNEYIKP